MSQQENNPTLAYLGDGVYASYDGFQIALHVGDHRTNPVIYLEDRTSRSLVEYIAKHQSIYITQPPKPEGE